MAERSDPETRSVSPLRRANAASKTVIDFALAYRWLGRVRVNWTALVPVVIELGFLMLVAVLFAAPYLDFDPQVHPLGNDYSMTVQFHSVWLRLRECGLCFFWNGGVNGGGPAFADLFPSSLHPLVIVTTLGWGIVNGTKLALVGIFFMAGLAQWWLARVLGLGVLARMWSAILAVVAGNIAGRMQMGWFGVALGTAATALVFPPLIQVALTGSRRAAVMLGITLAFAAAAGQGYMQFGLVVLLPLVLLVVLGDPSKLRGVGLAFGQAILIALLVGAPFFLPFLINWNQFSKAFDVNLQGIQPFNFILLNFIVRDPEFFGSGVLRMDEFPALYTNYIGWIAVLLALAGVRLARPGAQARVMLFLLASAAGAIFLASLEPRQFLMDTFPNSGLVYQIQSLRSSPVIAGLAVLPILGLGAIGLDGLFKRFSLKLQIALQGASAARPVVLSLNWLLILPLVHSAITVAQVNQTWLHSTSYSPVIPRVVKALGLPYTEWVQPPFGEADYLVSAMEAGLKVTKYPFSWGWKDREPPKPLVIAEGKWSPEETTQVGTISGAHGINLFRTSDENEYAQLESDAGMLVNCDAHARAGDIDVQCNSEAAGTLTLKENNWAGWSAVVDGQGAALKSGRWLAIEVPPGAHTIQFRYRPWDGMLGLVLFLVGCIGSVYLWRTPESHPDRHPSSL